MRSDFLYRHKYLQLVYDVYFYLNIHFLNFVRFFFGEVDNFIFNLFSVI